MKINDIKIGKRYRKDVGDIQKLADSIKELGLLHPIVVNEKNELIAGQRRIRAFKLLEKKDIPITKLNINDLLKGELHENTVRKDFTVTEVLDIHKHVKDNTPVGRPNKERNLRSFSEGASSKAVEAITGYGSRTIEKLSFIEKHAPEELEIIEKGIIDKVFREVNKDVKKKVRESDLKKTQINLPKTVQLYNKDFNKLQLPKNKISLIFTDPPYAEEHLHFYNELGKQASEVLRDGGSLVTYAGHFAIGRIINMIEKHGLKFHWPIAVLHSGPSASVFGYKVLVAYKPMLWFTKGKYEGDFVRDVIKSEFQGKELHEWAQSTVESDYYIKHMTLENDIVYDPFMGQGTFGVSAIKLKRQFIGCEIDKHHFDNAQRILTNANKS